MKLYGKNPVLERLKTNPKSIRRILVQEDHADAGYVRKKANQWGISCAVVPRSKMLKIGRNINVQGILAEVDDFAYLPYDELLDNAVKQNRTIIFLDNLNDPQNLGAIIRSLACLGGFSIVLPTHDSVEVTEAVLRVASGAENHVPIAKVGNLNNAISNAKKSGFWVAGTVVTEGKDLMATPLLFPLCLVMGSEQKGVRDIIRKNLDLLLTIPMAAPRLSLNVAQATTIFCYEIKKQKENSRKA